MNKSVPVSVVGIFSYDGAQVSWEIKFYAFVELYFLPVGWKKKFLL